LQVRVLPAEFVFWVYILRNPAGKFYVGSSDNPDRRLVEHNSDLGNKTFTHKNGPWELVWREPHPTRGDAVTRERRIKSMKSAKWIREHLLNSRVPTGRD
jgi:putative endonuclease